MKWIGKVLIFTPIAIMAGAALYGAGSVIAGVYARTDDPWGFTAMIVFAFWLVFVFLHATGPKH